MRLAYWHSERPNFGDDMNLWFWDRVLPGWKGWRTDETYLFGIGTILNDTSLSRAGYPVVLGSGTGYTPLKPAPDYPRVDFRFVRGPLTAGRLGLSPDLAISDPAILTPEVLDAGASHGNTIFVPHHATAALDLPWARWCEAMDVELLSPSGESEQVIRRIAGARLVIAESMHAAIIADAYRVPWVALQISGGFNEFKWRDWASGLDVEFTSIQHAAKVARFVKNLVRGGKEKPAPAPTGASRPAGNNPAPASAPSAGTREPARSAIRYLSAPLGLGFKAVLRQALRHPPSLSGEAILQHRRQQMRDALSRTADTYGA